MDIKVSPKSAFILKVKMLSMFAPFSRLSDSQKQLYGLLAYYHVNDITLTRNSPLTKYLVADTGFSKQMVYNLKVDLKKKGLLNGDGLNTKYLELVMNNKFEFNFITS